MGGQAATSLPAGNVTFVFTDIEGSTPLARALGEDYAHLIDLHHDCLRNVWPAHHGVEVSTEGDAFFVVFADADDAVAATHAGQCALAEVTWPTERPVRVRMGIHTGYARPHRGDYATLTVNQGSRIVSVAHGGQVLLSDDAADAVTKLPAGTELEALGRFRVRDFPDPPTLYRLRSSVLARDLPPRAQPAEGHNIVAPATSLLGRTDDLAVVAGLVEPGAVTSVVGPGGIGKTRLVVEFGLQATSAWPDGVWFVDLAPTSSGSRVVDAVAEAIGATAVPGQDAVDDVLDHLAGRRTLVILDNCEHLAPAPARLAHDLITRCPGVGILATSRATLGLREERVHRLGPLPGGSESSPAVQLFRSRSGSTDAADLTAIEQLCEALDGLPLAIELAASKARSVGVPLLLDELEHSMTMLRTNDPTLPERQQTIEALLDWSYDLLDEADARVFRFLGSFTSGIDGAIVRDVVGPVAESLATLIDQSLLRREEGSGSPGRFSLPATVRSYARSLSSGRERRRDVHALAIAFDDRLGPEHATGWRWYSDMAVEIHNVRGVVQELVGSGEERAQRLVWSLGQFHDQSSAYATGVDEVAHFAALLPERTPTRVAVLALLAYLHLRLDRLHEAGAVLDEAAVIEAAVGPPDWDDACVARTRGELLLKQGAVGSAVSIGRGALATATSVRSRARLLNLIGIGSAMQGDLSGAADAFTEELGVIETADLDLFLASTHGNLAEAHLQLGNVSGAAQHQLAALEQARSNADDIEVAYSVLVAARLCRLPELATTAVTLHTAGRRALEEASFSLYDRDRELLEAELSAAVALLDDAGIDAAVQRGRDLSLPRAADAASDVLAAAVHEVSTPPITEITS